MDTDLIFVIGLVLAGFAIPAIVSAFSDQRAPRAPAIMVLIGGGMIAWAVNASPHDYTLGAIPEVFARVVGRYIN